LAQCTRLREFNAEFMVALNPGAQPPSTLPNAHAYAVLMIVGYLWLMGEGVLAGIAFRPVPPSEGRVKAITAHALLQLRAIACIAGGFAVIFRNKVELVLHCCN
jgi:hypothetical protein